MALARGRRERRAVDYWPGFVDALSTLLLAIMFLLSVFVLAQFLLSREISGKDEVLSRLNSQINELTQLLALERSSSQDAQDQAVEARIGDEGRRDLPVEDCRHEGRDRQEHQHRKQEHLRGRQRMRVVFGGGTAQSISIGRFEQCHRRAPCERRSGTSANLTGIVTKLKGASAQTVPARGVRTPARRSRRPYAASRRPPRNRAILRC